MHILNISQVKRMREGLHVRHELSSNWIKSASFNTCLITLRFVCGETILSLKEPLNHVFRLLKSDFLVNPLVS